MDQVNNAQRSPSKMATGGPESLSKMKDTGLPPFLASENVSEKETIDPVMSPAPDSMEIGPPQCFGQHPSVNCTQTPSDALNESSEKQASVDPANGSDIEVTTKGPLLGKTSSSSSNLQPVLRSPSDHYPSITLRSNSRGQWVPAVSTRLLNNLTLAVGFLELTNALDFPANVWNSIPVPLFAQALMGIGGGLSILWSFFAIWDMILAYRNLRILLEERSYLITIDGQLGPDSSHSSGRSKSRLCDPERTGAFLDLNFREAGWEFFDRLLMDAFNGLAGIVVGTGTLLAIEGANLTIYRVSNLLSGYIGNGLNVLYGAINVFWNIFMLLRSRRYHRSIDRVCMKAEMKRRMRTHFTWHQRYALLQLLTVVMLSVGSMMSATMWQGYVVLVTPVFASIVLNLVWRHGIGYNRELVNRQAEWQSLDVGKRLLEVVKLREVVEKKGINELVRGMDRKEMMNFLLENGMFEVFCGQLLLDLGANQTDAGKQAEIEVGQAMIEKVDSPTLLKIAEKCLERHLRQRLKDQEQWLTELWACFLSQRAAEQQEPLDEMEMSEPA